MRIVVVGGGMQGRVIAHNLRAREESPEVVIADKKEPLNLEAGIAWKEADILDPSQARTLAQGADAVVLAVPSSIAHQALSNLVEAGATVADVSFTPDPPLDLNQSARRTGACCVIDCGVAPGLSHILVGRAHEELGGLDWARIWVGGMPQKPPPVFKHAIYFNAHDLFSEYIRPARAREGGQDVAPAPLDVPIVRYNDSELGELEAFLSDGLRSLLTSFPDVADLAELTLRWPGHLDAMKDLREMGFFEEEAARYAMGDTLAARYPAHKYPDVLVLFVEAGHGREKRTWRVIDRSTSGQTAMSRTTGYTTAATAMLLARQQFAQPGVHPPEDLGKDQQLTELLLDDLRHRGIDVRNNVSHPVSRTN